MIMIMILIMITTITISIITVRMIIIIKTLRIITSVMMIMTMIMTDCLTIQSIFKKLYEINGPNKCRWESIIYLFIAVIFRNRFFPEFALLVWWIMTVWSQFANSLARTRTLPERLRKLAARPCVKWPD